VRKKASYFKKYGDLTLYTALQREAAHARWKVYYRQKYRIAFVMAIPCPFTLMP
jgi:hypothetical protein